MADKKRVIMLLTNAFEPDVRVYKEASYLISKGFSVTILCWDKDLSKNYPEEETVEGIQIVRFKIPSVAGTGNQQIPAFLKYIRACKQYLQKQKCDYLHCNDLDGVITGYLARHGKTPLVFDMHEFYSSSRALKNMLLRNATIFFLKKSKAGLYENAAYLEAPYKSVHKKLYPLRNYPDKGMVEPRPKSESKKFRVAYNGVVRTQIPEFTALFEAAKQLPGVRIDINGGGIALAKLKELEASYKNFADVHVNGPYDGTTESSGLYEKTDALFCGYSPDDPNYKGDAEVIKYYEAIYTGTPMIMTESTGMAQKIVNNGYGVICDTRDSKAIRKAIEKLMNDHTFWKTCSENELADAYKYDWAEAVKILDQIYINDGERI